MDKYEVKVKSINFLPPIIGLIGGMGSLATIKTYSSLMNILPVELRHVLIDNLPIENVFENLVDDVVLSIMFSADRLSNMGVKLIAIPCNTVHCYEDKIIDICKSNDVKFISIIERTVAKCCENGYRKVSILATPTACELYTKKLNSVGIECITPNYEQQIIINSVIKDVLLLSNSSIQHNLINKIISIGNSHITNYEVDSVLLACTELPIIFGDRYPEKYLSTIDILSVGIVEEVINLVEEDS